MFFYTFSEVLSILFFTQVNHLSKRHPEMRIEEVPELTLPIIKPNRDYFCQYCDKVCTTCLFLTSVLLVYLWMFSVHDQFAGLQECKQAQSSHSEEPPWCRVTTQHKKASSSQTGWTRPHAEYTHSANRHHCLSTCLLPSLCQAV